MSQKNYDISVVLYNIKNSRYSNVEKIALSLKTDIVLGIDCFGEISELSRFSRYWLNIKNWFSVPIIYSVIFGILDNLMPKKELDSTVVVLRDDNLTEDTFSLLLEIGQKSQQMNIILAVKSKARYKTYNKFYNDHLKKKGIVFEVKRINSLEFVSVLRRTKKLL